jgi:hypothetical protein
MRLTEMQSRALLERYGAFVTEICDKCGKILGPIRFTRCGQAGAWCSKSCRDGFEHKPGTCLGCGVPFNGKRKGALFCSDVCRKRFRVEALRNIAERRIQNSGLIVGISGSRCVPSLNLGKVPSRALIVKLRTPTLE